MPEPVWRGVIARYGHRMAIDGIDVPVTLCEGGTPLIPAPRIARELGLGCDLQLKYEGLNPTGSFKDRGMTAAMTQAAADGARVVMCASTGNTAASAAAYASRAGMRCVVVVPDGKVALGKLAGAVAYGARVVAVKGSFDDGLRLVREATEASGIALVNSLNPARIEGQKTAAFEVCEALGGPPDWLCLPVGNAGNITAYWKGFREEAPRDALPRLVGGQAAGAAPLVLGHPVEHPDTVATAIRIGNPARWTEARAAIDESAGLVAAVEDAEILRVYRMLAHLEGVFCEPSSAAGLAALAAEVARGAISVAGRTVVCVLTGHGLKDPDAAMASARPCVAVEPRLAPLLEAASDE
jgi:threonine synthase